MVHVTEDLVDDALDRAGDFERGMRHSLSDALDDDRRRRDRDHDDHDHRDHDDRHRDRGRDRDRDRDRDCGRDRDRDDGCDRDRHRDRDGNWDGDRDGPDRRPRATTVRRAGPPSREEEGLSALTERISLLADRLEQHRDDGRGMRTPGVVPPPRDAQDVDALRADLAALSARLDRLSDVAR
ncbi:hypothetical protein [Streptomyces nitrosporeus]|uniref:hypothetical protein n=1 Tax=Streptomyces nitrosporeus TaxID=28894 RepID=UPI00123DB81D|nr:hypothetical protein [Streptomyces nitrosporeus]